MQVYMIMTWLTTGDFYDLKFEVIEMFYQYFVFFYVISDLTSFIKLYTHKTLQHLHNINTDVSLLNNVGYSHKASMNNIL